MWRTSLETTTGTAARRRSSESPGRSYASRDRPLRSSGSGLGTCMASVGLGQQIRSVQQSQAQHAHWKISPSLGPWKRRTKNKTQTPA